VDEEGRTAGNRGHWMEVQMKTADGKVQRKDVFKRQANGT
jgi:hypothetical protein